MIYVCVVTRNQSATAGLVLWKLRKVFQEYPREYHILVADDASTDGTSETLDTYQRALPLTLHQHQKPQGAAACLEGLLRDALGRSDRPKRDCVVTLPADFSVSPAVLPDLVRRFESGADVVVGEVDAAEPTLGMRLVRRHAARLLRPGVSLPGIRDLTSGVSLIRLITLKNCLRDRPDGLLTSSGASTHAELVARAAAGARQISAVGLAGRPEGAAERSLGDAIGLALDLLRSGRRLRIPAPSAPVSRG